ncbi:hypothetical protein FACS189462_4800 [Spirochaetia bacterium]|nr:hypothetical protein FACS189462_4800 [Spirochaetia bacterium]
MASLEYEVVINRIVGVLQEYGSLLKRLKYFPQSIEKEALLGNDSRYQDAIMDKNHLIEMLRKLNDDGLLEMYNNCRDLARIYGLTVGKFLTRADNITKSSGIKENNPVKYTDKWGLYIMQSTYIQGSGKITSTYWPTTSDGKIIFGAQEYYTFSASNNVRNELNGRKTPDAKTIPSGADAGKPKEYYYPREFPVGTWDVGLSIQKSGEDVKIFGTVFVPTSATQTVPTYGTSMPQPDQNGNYNPTGSQTDGGYGYHFSPTSSTTLGCLRAGSQEDANKFAALSDKAIKSGGKSTLTVSKGK